MGADRHLDRTGIILSPRLLLRSDKRYRPVVFTDERTLLNGAVAHQSVKTALASQIVPLVDSGFGPRRYLAQRIQASPGGWGWFETRQGGS